MKKQDLELIQEQLKQIKDISDRLDYNTSSSINQKLVKITPVVKTELERLNTEKITINCPKFMTLISSYDKVDEDMNKKLQELVVNDYKIIDFGIFKTCDGTANKSEYVRLFIKYTS